MSELEYGCRELKRLGVKMLAVTGSKGKSSVVKLVADALNLAGMRATPCGNYGLPVSELANQLSASNFQHSTPAWAVVEVTAKEIDERNILQCSILGMQRALDRLSVRPGHILVDGNKWKPYVPEGELLEIPADTVVHGDATYLSIAAASVLAKTYRDDYMLRLHEEYPLYGWDTNKGYPTAEHYAALKKYGPTPYHRMTFNLKINV